MKYLKFFEELNPDTYRRAAVAYRNYSKNSKADRLTDHADMMEYGEYKINILTYSDSTKDKYRIRYAEITSNGIGYDIYIRDGEDFHTYDDYDEMHHGVADDVEIYVTFYTMINNEEDIEIKHNTLHNDAQYSNRLINLFTFAFSPHKKVTVKDPNIIARQFFDGVVAAMFSDRRSAIKFKKWLNDNIENIEKVLFDVYINTDVVPESIENDINELKNLKIHSVLFNNDKDNLSFNFPLTV